MKTLIGLREISVSAECGQFLADEVRELHEILKARGGKELSFTYYKGEYLTFWSNCRLGR